MRMEIRRSFETPSQSLHIVFLYSELVYELFKIKVLYNDKEIFFGHIDRQKIVRSDKGNFLSIEARNVFTALIECESQPLIYYGLSLKDAFAKFMLQFGVTRMHATQNPIVPVFRVEKGTSQWEAFANFCNLSMNTYPLLIGSEIYAQSKTPDAHHFITENTDYMEMEYIFNHYDSISTIYMYNHTIQNYDFLLSNGVVTDKWPLRTRFYNTTKEEQPYREKILRKKYKNCLRTHHQCRITFHGFRDYQIGDFVSIDDSLMRIFNSTILDIKYVMDSNGVFTVIELGDGTRNNLK